MPWTVAQSIKKLGYQSPKNSNKNLADRLLHSVSGPIGVVAYTPMGLTTADTGEGDFEGATIDRN